MSTSRRRFLKLMGASAALPVLPSAAEAAGTANAESPRRLVIIYTPNGTVPGKFFPPESADKRNFTPGEIFEPFKKKGYVDDLTFFEGFNNVYGDDGHWSVGSLLTGVSTYPQKDHKNDTVDGQPKGPSLDQVIGSRLKGEASTPISALNLGICADGYNTRRPQATISYSGDKSPVLPENNPDRVFQNLFGDLDKSAGELADIRADRKSVLDLVRRNFDGFRENLSREDRKRVDAHFQSVRKLEKRIAATDLPNCKAVPNGFGGQTIDWSQKSNSPRLSEMQRTLLVKSFECDMTRVATLMYSQENNGMAMTWLNGHSSSDVHHHWSHMRNPVHDDDAPQSTARQKLLDINQWYAGEIADLVTQLKQTTDPVANDGSTLFDNTVIAWVNNLYDGGKHNTKNLPLVTIGDAGGALDSGQIIRESGRSHQDFLVTLSQAVGVDHKKFGDPKNCTGPVTEALT